MIELQNVSYQYHKLKEEAVQEIQLTIPEGKVISIIGKNGSGKSTMAKLIGGITKPTKGKVLVDKLDTSIKDNFLAIRKKIGMVFQNPENQIIFPKVYDDMTFILNNLGLKNEKERIENALKKVGMQGENQSDTYELSLGQKQRIAIATMLAVEPKYLVLDEPTAMIDPNGKEKIYQIIRELKKQGYTIIYVTNQIDEILLSDIVVLMEKGRIKEQFEKQAILEHIESLRQSDIKIPEIIDMIIKLKQDKIVEELNEWTIEEIMDQLITKLC